MLVLCVVDNQVTAKYKNGVLGQARMFVRYIIVRNIRTQRMVMEEAIARHQLGWFPQCPCSNGSISPKAKILRAT